MNKQELAAIHYTAQLKGFWDAPYSPDLIVAKLALIHSEVSETMEAYRKQQGSERILEEFADTFIRLYDLIIALEEFGIIDHSDIDWVIREKMSVNAQRDRLHGNLI